MPQLLPIHDTIAKSKYAYVNSIPQEAIRPHVNLLDACDTTSYNHEVIASSTYRYRLMSQLHNQDRLSYRTQTDTILRCCCVCRTLAVRHQASNTCSPTDGVSGRSVHRPPAAAAATSLSCRTRRHHHKNHHLPPINLMI